MKSSSSAEAGKMNKKLIKGFFFFTGGNTFFFVLIIIIAVEATISAAIACDAGYANKRHEEEEVARIYTLDHFKIEGKKESEGYLLSFLFNGWNIKDISIPLDQKEVSIDVELPAISGKNREEYAYKYFISKGFTEEGAAGLIANIAVESAHTWDGAIEEEMVPEYRGEDVMYKGYGLCQWTNTGSGDNISWRRKNVIEYVKKKGIDPAKDSDKLFLAELEYIITEPGYSSIVEKVKYSKSASKAAEIWVREWEVPADMENNVRLRSSSAEEYLKTIKNTVVYDDESKKKKVKLSLSIKEENDVIYFEGTLDGTDIAGSFDVGSDDKITGMGEYGTGASSGGAIGNPFGGEKFTCTSVALVERFCPYHQCREVHGGWDFCCGDDGQTIYSVSDGVVEYAGPDDDFGNHFVIIKTGDLYIYYGHMSDNVVYTGDKVKKGQKVGNMGDEGNSVGAHLHLEFRKGSRDAENKTAELNNIRPMLMRWCSNYEAIESDFERIEK